MRPWPTRSAPTAGRFALDFAGKIRYPIRQTIAKGKESIMVFGFLTIAGDSPPRQFMDKQNKYDSETEHGTIPDKQDEWNKKYE